MKLSRKELLVAGAGVAMTPLAAGCARPARGAVAPFAFDRTRFDAILAKPARHRQCCGATKVEGGAVLHAMVATMYAYEFDLAEGPGTVHEVAVLYQPAGIILGLNDAMWDSMVLPALPRLSDYFKSDLSLHRPRGAHRGNPYLHRQRSTALQDDVSIEALVARGANFFVCNNALLGLADTLATTLHEESHRVYTRLIANLVPGAMAVPAGVMAINACQEAHFTYLQVNV